MNGWTVVILLADVAALVTCVVQTRRYTRPEDLAERRMNYTALALGGALVAGIAVRAAVLGWYGTVMLLGAAFTAGMAARFGMAVDRGSEARYRAWAYGGATFFSFTIVAALVTSIVDDPARPHTPAQQDSARFGVKITDDTSSVPDRVLGHRPSLADAGVTGGVAVPVARYALDSGWLTLVVPHDLTCLASVVLLAPDDGTLDVLVVYRPSGLTDTGSPWRSPVAVCQIDHAVFTAYTAIRLILPADLQLPRLRDVGGNGPAVPTSPTP